ncbi:glycosyltransferase family 2 protein [Corallococcus sp. H22C18031201]|uniref:glycosyltransferase family 2 protein n=1 Tax=Citreicoccus inhibens TaxID=2849499 RepID=UPI000E733B7E|nr:glycosyltransferase [Citreicoccus inhibens]MBU8895072.1 glycosyltransferase [Citreicoccus inhibens]RJS27221.1 glycosyltransferase family 2 protein [Corallococcus sp. H22C18031201]
MSQIDVSVVMPTHRREKEVVEAIRSALRQEGVRVEVIVLDDTAEGTAREAVEALGDARVRYLKQEVPSRGKPALVRNHGATLAQGRYLHFLDDDDMLADGALHAMVGALDARPDAGVAVGWVVPFSEDADWLQDKRTYFEWAAKVGASTPNSAWTVAHILFRGTLMVNSACMVRREHFAKLGGFDPNIPVYEDVDFYLRGIRHHGHVYVNRPILHYRVGKPSLMHNLGKDGTLVMESNAIIHSKYRRAHGELEYRALQLVLRALPFDVARRLPLRLPRAS